MKQRQNKVKHAHTDIYTKYFYNDRYLYMKYIYKEIYLQDRSYL
jgi:hypothetical protein